MNYSNEFGPQKSPSSIHKINAEHKFIQKQLEEIKMQYRDKARQFAQTHHAGQVRENGDDYFTAHLEKVANSLVQFTDPKDINSDEVDFILSVAYLHDIVEDTKVTLEDLRKEFSEEICDAVEVLTRKPNETYFTFINRIISCGNPLVKSVKIADLGLNMSDATENQKLQSRYAKYEFATEKLVKSILDDLKKTLEIF